MLKDAQRQVGRARRTITNESLLLFATTAMLTTEIFPRANYYWEECAERDKTWLQWKLAYKKSHAKARIKAQANKGTIKFGAANSTAHQETAPTVENRQKVDYGGMKALEGYFDNLAAAAVNEKSVLQQLVLNNNNLAASNKILVALFLTRASRKAGKSAVGVQTSATTARKKATINQTLAMSLLKTRTSAPLAGESLCGGVGRSEYIARTC